MNVVNAYLNLIQEAGFEDMPKGWSKKSVKKAARTLGKTVGKAPESKGFFDKCVARMKKHMDNPEGYCASLKDETFGSTYWRGKDKSPQKARKMMAKHRNV